MTTEYADSSVNGFVRALIFCRQLVQSRGGSTMFVSRVRSQQQHGRERQGRRFFLDFKDETTAVPFPPGCWTGPVQHPGGTGNGTESIMIRTTAERTKQ